jgi:hypothetical protein
MFIISGILINKNVVKDNLCYEVEITKWGFKDTLVFLCYDKKLFPVIDEIFLNVPVLVSFNIKKVKGSLNNLIMDDIIRVKKIEQKEKIVVSDKK